MVRKIYQTAIYLVSLESSSKMGGNSVHFMPIQCTPFELFKFQIQNFYISSSLSVTSLDENKNVICFSTAENGETVKVPF